MSSGTYEAIIDRGKIKNHYIRRKDQRARFCNKQMAGATGLEPAASCVTGRRSNQLNYAPAF